MADSAKDAHSEDEQPDIFRHVQEALKLDLLPEYASRLRHRQNSQPQPDESPIDCKVVSDPLAGSNHILFQVDFEDQVQWLLKVPANGYQGAFDEMSARALRSEALTMRLVKSKTTIPVPEVYEFSDSCDNPLGCPFILMEYIDGRWLFDAWFERDIPPEILEQNREQALRDVASAVIQLNQFSFGKAGTLTFDADGNLGTEIGPFREVNMVAMLDRLSEEDYEGSNLFSELEPMSDPKTYFTHMLDRRDLSNIEESGKGMHKLLGLFIDSAVKECRAAEDTDHPAFVLAHPDLDIQNVIVSKTDGRVLSLIDWDGVATVPQCMFGNEGYPSWLTRDWDAMKYAYKSPDEAEGDTTASDAPGHSENSPAELASYREKWKDTIARITGSRFATKVAHNSLVVYNLKIAADDPVCRDHIVMRIFEEAKATTVEFKSRSLQQAEESSDEKGNVPSSSSKGQGDDEFYLYEVCTKLANGKLEEDHYQRLVDGFKGLFLHDHEVNQH